MQASFNNQLYRLLSAGFPHTVLTNVAEAILQKVKGHTSRKVTLSALSNTRPEVAPYIHKMPYNLKKVANRYGVPLLFLAPKKLVW